MSNATNGPNVHFVDCVQCYTCEKVVNRMQAKAYITLFDVFFYLKMIEITILLLFLLFFQLSLNTKHFSVCLPISKQRNTKTAYYFSCAHFFFFFFLSGQNVASKWKTCSYEACVYMLLYCFVYNTTTEFIMGMENNNTLLPFTIFSMLCIT